MIKQNRLPIILCLLYCFIEILLSTEIVYLIQSKYLSLIKYIIAVFTFAYFVFALRNIKLDYRAIYLLLLLFVAAGVVFFAKSLHILMLVVFLFLFRNYKFEVLLKYFYFMLWTAFVLTVFLSIIKVYPNINHSRQGTIRHALGFATPTLGQSVILFLLLSKFYLSKFNMSAKSIALYVVLTLVVYYFTVGRTGFYLGVFALITIIFFKMYSKRNFSGKLFTNKSVKFVLIIFPIICLAVSLILTKLYDNGSEFAIKLNDLSSTRLLLQRNAFAERRILIFGQKIDWRDEAGIYIGIDNSYLYHLFNYGIIVFLLAMALYSFMIKSALSNKDYCLLLVAVIILINAFVEPYMIDFKYNFFVFYPMIFKYRKKEKNINLQEREQKNLRLIK